LLASVTLPVYAKALPCKLAPVPMVILVCAKMFPAIALPDLIAAELATVHHRSQGEAPFRLTIDAPGPAAVVSEVVRIM
jgi:hypothetical protein